MHPATKTNIAGQLAVIRQCLLGVEAALAADSHQISQKVGKGTGSAVSSAEDDMYLSAEQDRLLGVMMGLEDDDQPLVKKKSTKAKEGAVNG